MGKYPPHNLQPARYIAGAWALSAFGGVGAGLNGFPGSPPEVATADAKGVF